MAQLRGGSSVGGVPIETTIGAQSKANAAREEAKTYADQKKVPTAVTGTVQPSTGLVEGLMWYNPTLDETKVFLNGAFKDVGGKDAQTLNGLSATSFIRSDVPDSIDGVLTVNTKINFNTANGRIVLPVGTDKWAT